MFLENCKPKNRKNIYLLYKCWWSRNTKTTKTKVSLTPHDLFQISYHPRDLSAYSHWDIKVDGHWLTPTEKKPYPYLQAKCLFPTWADLYANLNIGTGTITNCFLFMTMAGEYKNLHKFFAIKMEAFNISRATTLQINLGIAYLYFFS